MDIITDIWKSLRLSAQGSAYASLSSIRLRYHDRGGGNLVYKNNRAYKSVVAHVIKQTAMQAAEAEVNKLFPRYKKYIEDKIRKPLLKDKPNVTTLIKDGSSTTTKYGKLTTDDGRTLYAQDRYGNFVEEALILSYTTDYEITVKDARTNKTSQTKTLSFIDLSPNVSVQNSKNLILTPVQGRDFTRKELIAGGDIVFSVSGFIVSDEIDKYPANEVQKFIQIMQYGGIVKVNHIIFGQFNVTQMLIKEFSLGHPDCKNMQPYSFSCVAVELDKQVAVSQDTIGALNREISQSNNDKKYKLLLNNKLAKIGANAATDLASSVTSFKLDTLIPTI